jgi:hypothetical protein
MDRKLCFFIKTQWTNNIEAAGLSDYVQDIKIRNGRVIANFRYDRWAKGNDLLVRTFDGCSNYLLQTHGFTENAIRMASLRFNQSGCDITANIDSQRLETAAFVSAAGSDNSSSFLMSNFDSAFQDLISVKNIIIPYAQYVKYSLVDIKDTLTESGFKDTYVPSFKDIYFFIIGRGNTPSNPDNKAAWESMKQAFLLTFQFALTNNKIDELFEKNFNKEDLFLINKLNVWTTAPMVESIAAANRIRVWVESISRELRGIGAV